MRTGRNRARPTPPSRRRRPFGLRRPLAPALALRKGKLTGEKRRQRRRRCRARFSFNGRGRARRRAHLCVLAGPLAAWPTRRRGLRAARALGQPDHAELGGRYVRPGSDEMSRGFHGVRRNSFLPRSLAIDNNGRRNSKQYGRLIKGRKTLRNSRPTWTAGRVVK